MERALIDIPPSGETRIVFDFFLILLERLVLTSDSWLCCQLLPRLHRPPWSTDCACGPPWSTDCACRQLRARYACAHTAWELVCASPTDTPRSACCCLTAVAVAAKARAKAQAAAEAKAKAAPSECKVPHCVTDQWSLTSKSCAVVGPTATPEGAGVCGYNNGPMFQRGDKFNDLALLKTRTTGKCNCVDKYEAAPDGYVAAYSAMCAGRLEDQGKDPFKEFPDYTAGGVTGRNTILYGKGENATAEKCASKCTAMRTYPGSGAEDCGGFIFNYYDDQMTCNAIGVNKFCKGTTKKGDEGKKYPEGPGSGKGLVEGHVGFAVFMYNRPMIMKEGGICKNEQGVRVHCRTGEAYTVCPPNHTLVVSDFIGFEKCVYNLTSGAALFGSGADSGAGGGPKYASASLVALAVAAAAAVKMC